MKLFLAEDDAVLADALLANLANLGFSVDHAADGFLAEEKLLSVDYDAAILDIGLPGQDGLRVLRSVRREKAGLPILLLTALDGVEDRVAGLDAGADDYLAKPFEFRELEARIKALLRRTRPIALDQPALGALRLDRAGQRAWAGDTALDLSARELAVLDILLTQRDKVVTKEQIAAEIGGEDLGANAIEVYVHRLRKKIEPSGVGIRTVRGLGYLMEVTKESA